jgi:hypothetical protein
MAHRNCSPKLRAGGNISPAVFVKVSAAAPHTCLQAGSGERVIGISQQGTKLPQGLLGVSNTYAAVAGDEVDFNGLGDVTRLTLGSGGCAAGDLLVSDTNGCGVVASGVGTAVQWVGAVALEDGLVGEKVEVQVMVLPVTLT